MNSTEELGEEVRRQGHPEAGPSTQDLYFDPVQGIFVLGRPGESGKGGVVTEMTREGFAA